MIRAKRSRLRGGDPRAATTIGAVTPGLLEVRIKVPRLPRCRVSVTAMPIPVSDSASAAHAAKASAGHVAPTRSPRGWCTEQERKGSDRGDEPRLSMRVLLPETR